MPVAVVGEGVAEHDVVDVLPFDEHVRLADGIALVVQLLPEHREAGLRVQAGEMLLRNRQHSSCARRRVVDGADHTRL